MTPMWFLCALTKIGWKAGSDYQSVVIFRPEFGPGGRVWLDSRNLATTLPLSEEGRAQLAAAPPATVEAETGEVWAVPD